VRDDVPGDAECQNVLRHLRLRAHVEMARRLVHDQDARALIERAQFGCAAFGRRMPSSCMTAPTFDRAAAVPSDDIDTPPIIALLEVGPCSPRTNGLLY